MVADLENISTFDVEAQHDTDFHPRSTRKHNEKGLSNLLEKASRSGSISAQVFNTSVVFWCCNRNNVKCVLQVVESRTVQASSIFLIALLFMLWTLYSLPPLASIEGGKNFVWRPFKVEHFRLMKAADFDTTQEIYVDSGAGWTPS